MNILELDEAKALEILSRSKKSLVEFRKNLLVNEPKKEVDAAPFHHEWSDLLLNGRDNFAVEAYRESAKSQYIARAFPIHCLVFPDERRDYVVFIKNTGDLAAAKLKDIWDEYMASPILRARLLKVHEQSGKVFDVTVQDAHGNPHRVRMEAYGKGSSIRGLSKQARRPKIVIIDDPQDLEDMESPTVLDKDWDWFLSDVKFLAQEVRVFMIGNNLGDKCIIERVSAFAAELKFKFIRLGVLDETGKPRWAARTTIEEVEEEKESYRAMGKLPIWLREKMCLAIDEETKLFKKRDFRIYQNTLKEEIVRSCNIFGSFDPAASMNPGSDFRAMVIVGIDSENKWYVLDISYGRFDPFTCIDEMFRLVLSYPRRNFQMFGIEKGALKDVYEPFILKEQTKRNQYFTIRDLDARTKKVERIKLLQPRFRAHSILFPESAPWLAELEAELEAISLDGTTRGMHDDLIDALAYIEQIGYAPTAQANVANLPRRAKMGG